jgi:hypothetical protein
MDQFHITSLGLFVFSVGFVTEGIAYLFYKRTKMRLKRLSGTGRMSDIEVAYNWHLFFRATMIAVPVLLYLLISGFTQS